MWRIRLRQGLGEAVPSTSSTLATPEAGPSGTNPTLPHHAEVGKFDRCIWVYQKEEGNGKDVETQQQTNTESTDIKKDQQVIRE